MHVPRVYRVSSTLQKKDVFLKIKINKKALCAQLVSKLRKNTQN